MSRRKRHGDLFSKTFKGSKSQQIGLAGLFVSCARVRRLAVHHDQGA